MVEAPRDAEDQAGEPLVASFRWNRPSNGVLVDQMLKSAGIDRSSILVMDRVRCQPTRNRLADFPEALANCEPWNVAEFAEYDPAMVVLMGNLAMRPVYGATARITGTRGVFRTTGDSFAWGRRTWAATWHPGAVGQTPGLMNDAVADLTAAYAVWKELA